LRGLLFLLQAAGLGLLTLEEFTGTGFQLPLGEAYALAQSLRGNAQLGVGLVEALGKLVILLLCVQQGGLRFFQAVFQGEAQIKEPRDANTAKPRRAIKTPD
jgi:hypothetical protein